MTTPKAEFITTIRLDSDLYERVLAVKTNYGIPLAQQIRRGLDLCLTQMENLGRAPKPAARAKGRR
jgi:hypothetical protein